MGEAKCIYCGKGKSDGVVINDSDIIPEGLTNAKIKYENVCSDEHNSKFSDKFEYKIIKELSFLRNHLNIIGKNTGNKFPEYEAFLKIDDDIYKRKVRSDSNLIGHKKIRSEDGSTLLGPLDELKKMKNSDEKITKTIDLNNTEIIKSVKLNLEIFTSEEIYRLACKIAYEWFCKTNNINGKNDIFNDVINFIVSGISPIGYDIVLPLSDKNVYELFKVNHKLGSHYLYSYISDDGNINVIVSIFGLALYKVRLCKNIGFKETTFTEEFMLIGKRKFISSKDLTNLFDDILNMPSVDLGGGLSACIPIQKQDSIDIADKFFMLSYIGAIQNFDNTFILDDFFNILIDNYKDLLCSSILDTKILKRFTKDYNLKECINLNKNSSNKEFWFLLYLVFDIGKNNYINLNLDIITNIAKNLFPDFNIIITDDIVYKLKSEIFENENHEQFIINGATIISGI